MFLTDSVSPTAAYRILVWFRGSAAIREKLLAQLVATNNPILALWALQDIADLGQFREKFLKVIVESKNRNFAHRALQSVSDCGTCRSALMRLADCTK